MNLIDLILGRWPHVAAQPAAQRAQSTTTVTDDGNELMYLLDRSGSMISAIDDLLKAVNATIENNRSDPLSSSARCHIVTFDSLGFDKIRDRELMNALRPITPIEVKPRGATPLNDAIAYCIDPIIEAPQKGKKIVIVFTDGLENASKKYRDVRVLRERIETFQRNGNIIIFLAANLDAQKMGESMGVPLGRSLNTRANGKPGTSAGLMSAFGAATALGFAYWALKPGDAQAASQVRFTADDRKASMGAEDWRAEVQNDIDSHDFSAESTFNLDPETVEQLQSMPENFDPSRGSLDNPASENFKNYEASADAGEKSVSHESETSSHEDRSANYSSTHSDSYSSSSSDSSSSGGDSGGGGGGGGD